MPIRNGDSQTENPIGAIRHTSTEGVEPGIDPYMHLEIMGHFWHKIGRDMSIRVPTFNIQVWPFSVLPLWMSM
jgi:hypothetical protein